MIGVIPAAGRGNRIGGNKPLKLVKGKYLIEYPFDLLISSGITRCVVIQQEKELERMFGSEYKGLKLSYVSQPKPTGIAPAIALAEPFTKDEDICVVLGDIIFKDNLRMMKRIFDELKADGLVAGRNVKNNEMNLISKSYGITKKNIFVEKPEKLNNLKSFFGYGIYMFSPAIYNAIKETPSNEITEVLNSLMTYIYTFKNNNYWNINTIDDLNSVD